MKDDVGVPVPLETIYRLRRFLEAQASQLSLGETIEKAIEYWMDNADWKPELLGNSGQGYAWRNKDYTLFLPTGTRIRMRYRSQFWYAEVQGDQILYEGDSLTPSQLASRVAGSSRNAWRDLWILRPNDPAWALADDLRSRDGHA